jgi:hypothetical protein
MTCSLYYDLFARDYYNVWIFLLSSLLFLTGIALYIVGGRFSGKGSLVSSILYLNFRIGGIGFALAWAVLGIYFINKRNADYDRLFALRSSGQERVVEGVVTNFSPFGPRPHSRPKETFAVNDVTFAYPPDDSTVMLGFSQLRSKGGPLRDNVLVRVNYIEDRIVRLEICNSANP